MATQFKVGGVRLIPNTDGSDTNSLDFANASNTLAIKVKAPKVFGSTGDMTYVLPASGGPSGSVLTDPGDGNLIWLPALGELQKTVVSVSSYLVLTTDRVVIFAPGAASATLPASLPRNELFFFNQSGGSVTLYPASGGTIGGQAYLVLTPGSQYGIIPN